MTPSLHICIDCGGSKTSAVLASVDGTILTRCLGGPSNFSYLGARDFTAVVRTTVSKGLNAIPGGLTLEDAPFISAWIAVSGVDTPTDVITVTEAMSALFSISQGPRLRVTNDTHILASPLTTQSTYQTCVVAIAGTGSCVMSFRKNSGNGSLQEIARTGGYGWILGDEGGGVQVGRECLRRLCLQADIDHLESNDTLSNDPFKAAVVAEFGLPPSAAPSDTFVQLYAPDPRPDMTIPDAETHAHLAIERAKRLSNLAPIVFRAAFAATNPSHLALEIVTTCATALADQIALLCAPSTTNLKEKSNYIHAKESLLCLGGSLVGQAPYRTLLANILRERGHDFAEVVFVKDCEQEGIKALVATSSSSS